MQNIDDWVVRREVSVLMEKSVTSFVGKNTSFYEEVTEGFTFFLLRKS